MGIEYLLKCELFYGIEKEEIERIIVCSNSRFRKFEPGGVVFQQEEKADRLFVLLKGRVSMVKYTRSGNKKLLYSVEENDIFGEQCLYKQDGRQWYHAEANTASEVLEIPWRYFHCFCEQACVHHQQLLQNMLGMLARKGFAAMYKIYINNSTTLKEKISIWLLNEVNDQDDVFLRMKRDELADFLGVARPSLSRALMRMQQEKLIKVDKFKIHIINRNELENSIL